MQNTMIDLEPLGVTADAAIISIGAVQFELDGQLGDTFYRSVSIDSNLGLGRTISEETLLWWMGQVDSEARKVFLEAKISLQGALLDLANWLPDGSLVWSNGASHDIPMLEHAFKESSLACPWESWNSRCVRTYRSLPGASAVSRPQPKVAHNAMDRAIAQAQYIQAIYKALFANKAKEKA